MNERDNGPRQSGFRNSVDIYAAALTPRSIRSSKRSPKATVLPTTFAGSSVPHIFASVDPGTIVSAGPKSTTSTSTSSSSSSPTRPIMTFFSRFGHKSKSRLSVSTEKPALETKNVTHTHTRGNSLPNTPVGLQHQHKSSNGSASIKHRISSPMLTAVTSNTTLTRTESPVPIDGMALHPVILEQYPLCVARIQAIRTTILPQCTLSTEKLLRRDGALGTNKKDRRTSRVLQRSHVPTKSADMQWTKGLYVLMPGLILRYSGYGTEDRIPERALQLTTGSLAFASDIIPGRPWVLQITKGEDNAITPETGSFNKRHSLVSKVTFRGSVGAAKAAHSVMFMVFESAEEMDEWMTAVRQEAIRLGGGSRPSISISREPVLEEEPSIMEEDQLGTGSPGFNLGTFTNNTVSTLPATEEEEVAPDSPSSNPAAMYPSGNSNDNDTCGNVGFTPIDPSNSSSDESLSKRASTYTRTSFSSIPSQPGSSHGGNFNRLSTSIQSSTYSPKRASVISADRASFDFLRSSARPVARIPSTTVTTVSPETSPERSTSPHSTPNNRAGPRYRRFSRSSTELRIPPSIPSPGLEDQDDSGVPKDLFWLRRTPSPQPEDWSRRESEATTKTSFSTAPSLLPMSQRPQRRPVSMFPPIAATPIRRLSLRRRSLGAMSTHMTSPNHLLAHPPNRRLNSDQPIRRHHSRESSRDENRDDVLELGGPKFPPPSIPLPKVPDMKGERRGSRRERAARRRRASASTTGTSSSVHTRISECTDRPFPGTDTHTTPNPTPISTPRMKPKSIIIEPPPALGIEIRPQGTPYSPTPSSTPPTAVQLAIRMERGDSHDSRISIAKRRSFIEDLRDLEHGEELEAKVHRMEMEKEREERSEARKSFLGRTPPAFPPRSPYGGPGSEALGIGSVWI
ncbi:hypothetical protein EX30DRAFT_341861 [Ascodesmis nigricans]|uniref:PH domain-containing protein n=1 Tax=Ascodesmis nigricans TaxID=341454 RepID=A0A4S2MTY8_9PEZI|nr:hypothetical protein EX30DRAFT_341861 [Ascodesmis nigricans]